MKISSIGFGFVIPEGFFILYDSKWSKPMDSRDGFFRRDS
jgi:hypothetical protein